jgi:hypothetical protein
MSPFVSTCVYSLVTIRVNLREAARAGWGDTPPLHPSEPPPFAGPIRRPVPGDTSANIRELGCVGVPSEKSFETFSLENELMSGFNGTLQNVFRGDLAMRNIQATCDGLMEAR